MELCGLDERLIPCIDFGHLNARTNGALRSQLDFDTVFDMVEKALGIERMRDLHAHFSKIEYTEKGGEKRHLTFADTQYGPDFEPLMHALSARNCRATIICESAGTQAEDAQQMRQMFEKLSGSNT